MHKRTQNIHRGATLAEYAIGLAVLFLAAALFLSWLGAQTRAMTNRVSGAIEAAGADAP